MFRNYLKIAWRSILQGRIYSLLSIAGLSMGIAFTMLIAAYVWSQLQVDKSLKNLDQQYLLESEWKDPNEGFALATFGPLARELKVSYPDLVENYYRYDGITSTVSKGDKSFRENLQVGDSSFLNMYGLALENGDAATALKAPYTAVITNKTAIKYFGSKDVVGKTLTIENFSGTKHDFQVTGVLKELAPNSIADLIPSAPSGIFVSIANLDFFGRNMSWQNPFIVNFIELKKGVHPKDLEQPIKQLLLNNAPPGLVADLKVKLTPLDTLYLERDNGVAKKSIYALSGIAFFILLMAVINFLNLSISRAANRMREIGIRKVLGSRRMELIIQFLTESVAFVLLSTFVATAIYLAARRLFENILNSEVPSIADLPLPFIASLLGFIIVLGVFAGLYPAFFLSKLKSVESLKGKLSGIKDTGVVRRSLISIQFATSIIAIVAAIVISKQVDLFLKSDLGFDKDLVISAQVPRDWTKTGVNRMKTIRDELSGLNQLQNISLSYEIPDGNSGGFVQLFNQGTDSTSGVTATSMISDENYVDVYNIQLAAGSFFEGEFADSGKIILNNAAVVALGFQSPQASIGQHIRRAGDQTVFTIAGVVKDFHFGSLQQKITPLAFFDINQQNIFRFFSMKMKAGSNASSIKAIETKWKTLMPGAPFEYRFMDDSIARLYNAELRLQKAAYTASALTIAMVVLGMLGLISLSIHKRTREIGIRKVLGSSVSNIVSLFFKDFALALIPGALIAGPLAWIAMDRWLREYAYRIDLTIMPFVVTLLGLGILLASLIALQTAKAALANPVKSLRSE